MAFFSTQTALGSNGTITLGPGVTDRADRITGSVFADQAGTLYIEQSFDGSHWDVSTSISVTANDGNGFSEELVAPQVRVRYVNGGSAQGAFRLFSRYSSSGAT